MRMLTLVMIVMLGPLAAAASPAQEGIHRCVGADGGSIYTDRPCADFDAVERAAAPAHTGLGFARRGCSRTPTDLLGELRQALEARDVNRLAGVYHWTGTSSGGAVGIMDRLEALAERPLVQLELEARAEPVVATPADSVPRIVPRDPGAGPIDPFATTMPPPPAEPAPPEAVRVEQIQADGDLSPLVTRLALRHNAGCWWVEFL